MSPPPPLKKTLKFAHDYVSSLDARYLGKWLFIGGLIGIVAGLGSIAIFSSITWSTKLFLGLGAGYVPPGPAGEGATVISAIGRRWMIPVVTTLGGLLSGLIVFKFAPEAEGHGTDAAVDAFHNKEGEVRGRIPLVKLVASAITIGSGGSAGREGPTAQIAAGFGSVLGRILHLSPHDRRIAVAAGIGAGIGAIFKAPLGGAVLSTEILYLQGFEVEALIPSFIASIVGYSIFAAWSGFTPVFGDNSSFAFHDPRSLVFYVILGIACGLAGRLYSSCFYRTRDLFHKFKIPNYFKPAIGGLMVGLMGLYIPQVLGMGYGWIQLGMDQPETLGLGLMIGLIFAKILATSLSVGSGGSGGVFAPGLFIGGMIGASLWMALNQTFGAIGPLPVSPAPFVIVGMMALFGGIGRAPLAVMLMVSEMTESYLMLAAAMVAVGISYVIVGKGTIYESQVETPAQSPAHRYEYFLPLLNELKVEKAMKTGAKVVTSGTTLKEVEQCLLTNKVKSVPVLDADSKNLIGMVSLEDLLRLPAQSSNGKVVEDVMSKDVITVGPDDSLDTVLELLSDHDVGSLPVVEKDQSGSNLVGVISRRDVSRAHTAAAHMLMNNGDPTR